MKYYVQHIQVLMKHTVRYVTYVLEVLPYEYCTVRLCTKVLGYIRTFVHT